MNLYCYIYKISNKYIPLIEFINDNIKIKNNNYTKIIDDRYYFDFKHGFFDGISNEATAYIDKIFDYIDKNFRKDYLNRELWGKYVNNIKNKTFAMYYDSPNGIPWTFFGTKTKEIDINRNIDELSNILINDKKINTFFYDLKEKKPIDYKEIENKSVIEIDPLNKIPNNSCFINKFLYNDNLNNEIELVHRFMNLIFTFNHSLNIKKCWKCDRYFITTPSNTHNCDRIFKNELTCSEYSNKITRQHAHDKPIKDLKNYIRHKLQNDPYLYRDYSYNNSLKMEEFYGNKKDYILWLLENYCDSEEEEEKVKKRFNLTPYLN